LSLDLSIIIVSWNTRALLEDCLKSVYASLAETPELSVEVFVADNDSKDGSPELVEQEFGQAVLIRTGGNLGFARANNLALKRAVGRFHLLLNSDTLIPPGGQLASLVKALKAAPEAAVAGPLLLNADGTVQHSWARFPGLRSELAGALDRSQSPYPLEAFDAPEQRRTLEPFVCDWVGGAAFLVRAEVAVGALFGLDEKIFMYAEETEWCLRFARAGWKTVLVPSVQVVHLGGGSSQAVPGATRKRMWRGSLYFYRQAHGPFGMLPAAAVATARLALSPLRRRQLR
jgi:hypothetical protein